MFSRQPKFDYNDRNSFRPVIADAHYWHKKFHGALPDGYAELFETLSLYDYEDKDTQLVAQFIVQKNQEFADRLAQELAERETDSCIKIPEIKEIPAPPESHEEEL
jgi:hypothetical protein